MIAGSDLRSRRSQRSLVMNSMVGLSVDWLPATGASAGGGLRRGQRAFENVRGNFIKVDVKTAARDFLDTQSGVPLRRREYILHFSRWSTALYEY